jgi:predicted Zn-dependent protease
VHEQPVRADGLPPVEDVMPAHALGIEHRGYADPEVVRRKGEHRAHLAESELHALLRLRPHDRSGIAESLLALGRSLVTANRVQDAVDTFETLRELAPRTPQWCEGTDFLARILLGAGGFDDAVVLLADQLRDAGADPRYCDWLRAQALAQLGSAAEALELVRGIDELVDPAGRRHELGQVLEMRALMAALVGERQEALDALAQAMAHHGRVQGRGQMLLELWAAEADGAPAGHSPADLARIVREAGSGHPNHLAAIARELRSAGGDGPDVALALGA